MFCQTEPDMDYNINYYEYRPNMGAMSTTSSPYSQSSMDSPESSQMSTSPAMSPQTLHNLMILSPDELLTQNIAALSTSYGRGVPYLEIIEQPVDKFRFRYRSEMMGAHGSILGRGSVKSRRKTFPTVKLNNYVGKATIRCSLFTADLDETVRSPHVHRLIVRDGEEEKDDPHSQPVDSSCDYTATFPGMGIIHTAKKHLADELLIKKSSRLLEKLRAKNINIKTISVADKSQLKKEVERDAKVMNLNVVTLCFEAVTQTSGGVFIPICSPVYSTPINNMKSALTGELKICRIDKHSSSCIGNEEIFLLVEKVGKKNIQVRFFELDADDREVWSANGKFSELDVHHQFAIVLRTPPYKSLTIEENVDVFIELYRPSDGDRSIPIPFRYKPSEKTVVFGRKRARRDSTSAATNDPMLSAETERVSSLPSASELLQEYQAYTSEEFDNFYVNLPPGGLGIDDSDLLFDDLNITTDGARSRSRTAVTYPADATDADKLLIRVVHRVKELTRVNRPLTLVRDLFNEKTDDGDSALHVAVLHSNRSYLVTLLNTLCRGSLADVLDMTNYKEETALHLAVLSDQPTVVKALLSGGADCRRMALSGDAALHSAVTYGHNRCLEALLDNRPSDKLMRIACNMQGWSALHLAVLHNNLPALRRLLGDDCEVDVKDHPAGRTALHLAAGDEVAKEAVVALLKAGASVDAKDSAGNTPLHVAVAACAASIVRLLLEAQADPLAKNYACKDADDVKRESQTPFDLATSNEEMLDILLAFMGSDPSENVMVKLEVEDTEINSESDSETFLDEPTLSAICRILDENGGWVNMATLLQLDFLVASISNCKSPTKTLLNYADVHGTLSAERIRETLVTLNESKAVEAIDLMLAKLLAEQLDA